MNSFKSINTGTRKGLIAFLVVVVAGYVAYFSSGIPLLPWYNLAINIGLGIVYVTVGIWASLEADKHPSMGKLALMFVVQYGLALAISFSTRGTTWLVLLPMVGYAVQYLPRIWAVIAILFVWGGQVAPMVLTFGWRNMLPWSFALVAAIVFVVVFTQLMVNEQKARLELAQAHQQLQEYTAKVEELATLQERNRLAREIHDGLGHYLTAINIQIKAAQALVKQNPLQAEAALNDARQLSEDALADVRRSVSALRADPSSNRPLPEMMQALCEETRKSGLTVNFCALGEVRPLDATLEMTLYRAAQEGLTNIRKHARASLVNMTLQYAVQEALLTIEDNGQGCSDPSGGYGITGLRERLELHGGALQIETSPGKGFRLAARLPVSSEAVHEG